MTRPSARRLVLGVYAVYLAALVAVVFQPDAGTASGTVDLTVRVLHRIGFPRFTEWHIEKALNVVLFLPLGLLGAWLWPRLRWWAWAPLGFALSGFFEWVQGTFLASRVADVSDLVMNTAGSLAGAVVTVLAVREVRASRRPETRRPPLLPPALLALLVGGMLVVLVGLVLGPTSDLPGRGIIAASDRMGAWGAPEPLASRDVWEKLLNVALFVPIGGLAALLRPGWSLLRWGLLGLAGSLAIEMVQGTLLPDRDASFADLATNTAGMLLGAGAVKLVDAAARAAGRRRRAHV